MRDYTFSLNLHVKAIDEDHALHIAESMRRTIEEHAEFKTCSKIEIDDIEEL